MLDFAKMWSAGNPPITREQQQAAERRLHLPPLPPSVRHPDGSMTNYWYSGPVDLRDYTLRDGYVVRPHGFDRYGWPVGHPDSPDTERAPNGRV